MASRYEIMLEKNNAEMKKALNKIVSFLATPKADDETIFEHLAYKSGAAWGVAKNALLAVEAEEKYQKENYPKEFEEDKQNA